MSKILKFKSKNEKFMSWLENCMKDFDSHPPKSMLLLWENEDHNGDSRVYHSKFECDFNTFSYFLECMKEKYFEMRIERSLIDFFEKNLT